MPYASISGGASGGSRRTYDDYKDWKKKCLITMRSINDKVGMSIRMVKDE